MSAFRWTDKAAAVALTLADGATREQAAKAHDITERTVYRWLQNEEFAEEVDRLTLMTGIASRAERLRVAKRAIKQRIDDQGTTYSKADLLDWLKFAQGETQGIKLDIASLADAAQTLAGARPAGDDTPAGDAGAGSRG
jgi:transposase-like protein